MTPLVSVPPVFHGFAAGNGHSLPLLALSAFREFFFVSALMHFVTLCMRSRISLYVPSQAVPERFLLKRPLLIDFQRTCLRRICGIEEDSPMFLSFSFGVGTPKNVSSIWQRNKSGPLLWSWAVRGRTQRLRVEIGRVAAVVLSFGAGQVSVVVGSYVARKNLQSS